MPYGTSRSRLFGKAPDLSDKLLKKIEGGNWEEEEKNKEEIVDWRVVDMSRFL